MSSPDPLESWQCPCPLELLTRHGYSSLAFQLTYIPDDYDKRAFISLLSFSSYSKESKFMAKSARIYDQKIFYSDTISLISICLIFETMKST